MSQSSQHSQSIEPWLRGLLRCPVTQSELVDVVDDDGAPALESTEVDAQRGGRLRYPIRDGIPVLLADEASLVR